MTKYIPDCYWPEVDNGSYVSHEAFCVLNANAIPAMVNITLYFEDRDPIGGFSVEVPAKRTLHIRMDRLKSANGDVVPRGVPYAAVVECAQDISLQYTRVDTTQPELSIATAMV